MEIVKAHWDSTTFGYPVGILAVPPLTPSAQVAQLLQHDQHFKVVYVFSESPISMEGLDLFDIRETYAIDLNDSPKQAAKEVMPFGRTMTEAIRQLAHLSGEHSRFRKDPRFANGEFEQLYDLWIAGSVSRVKAEEVLVSGTMEHPTGMITLERADENTMRIGLISVSAQHWGQGIGKRLVQAAIIYALTQQCQKMTVASQSANIRASALYLSCGFRMAERRFTYHWWQK